MICRKVVDREEECGQRAIYTGEVNLSQDFVAVGIRCPEGHEALFYVRQSDRRASGSLVAAERQGH